MDPDGDPFVGLTVGNLVLEQRIGEGGMGAVYRATHQALRTSYAVKILRADFGNDDTVVERFRREAMACSRLQHEHVVYVTDFGSDPHAGLYLVMEFVDGPSLAKLLQAQRRMPIGRVGRIMEQVCEAMSAAHRLDIVHRDLKPDNILVMRDPARRDFVKVVDFGIARIRMADAEDEITAMGTTVGTVEYIAPEQLINRPGMVGPWSDIYALGVILAEMVSGAKPFGAGSMLELAVKHATAIPPLLSEARPELAGTLLESLVASMLAKDPKDRPASMEVVRDTLSHAVSELIERGVPDARYAVRASNSMGSIPAVGGERETSRPGLKATSSAPSVLANQSSASMRVRSLVQSIRDQGTDSAVATVLAALPGVDQLRGDALTMALWGVIQQEVLDAPLESPRFAQACEHLALLIGTVLESGDAIEPSESQQRVFRALRNVLALADKDRRARLVDALRPCSAHRFFPEGLVPKSDGRSLFEKLNQPVSGDSLRSVLTHRIDLFGAKKD